MAKGEVKTIGVIGLGSIGMRHKTNLWQHLGQTEVVGYDPDPDKQNGTGWVIGDVDKMIEMSDILIIASPTSEHCLHLSKCDLKPVFIEKPIGATWDDYEWLNNRKWGVIPEMVGYNLRFHSCVKQVKQWLDDGMCQRPLWANFTLGQYSVKPPYLRDGVILNWSHEIDLALYLLGPGRITGSSTRLFSGRDDLTDIMLNQSGCRTVIHLDYLTAPEVRQFIIVGEETTIIADLVHRMAWLRSKDDVILDQIHGIDTWDENYIEEMQAFLDRCDGKETIGCDGNEALETLKICLEVRKQAGLP